MKKAQPITTDQHAIGDRVRVVGVMPDDPDPIEIGSEGTIDWIGDAIQGRRQLGITWDCGRTLLLLDTDPFIVLPDANEQGSLKQIEVTYSRRVYSTEIFTVDQDLMKRTKKR